MAKITTYNTDSTITGADKVLGTNAADGSTANFSITDIASFISVQASSDVTVANLKTRLGQIDSNVTVGNGTGVGVTTSGDLTVTGDLTVNGSFGTTAINDITDVNITNLQDNQILKYDSASSKWVNEADAEGSGGGSGDITEVTAGAGLTGGATTGAATLNVGAGTGITVNADDIQISNDGVDHTQLANRYTALSALGTGASFALNFANATTFTATANATATFTFSNAKQGQVIDLILTGNYTINFSETGSTFNKVGSIDYDGSANNLIQIVCTDDTGGSKIYHYSIATYASDTTP
jgi:hypothetical protein